MLVAPVNASFDRVVIRRTGGIAGIDQTLTVGKDLAATVACRRDGDRSFQLDAAQAQELVHALSRVATERPTGNAAQVRDGLGYDIELTWNGQTYHVHGADVGADDALHGVMFAANRLMAGEEAAPFHTMEVHDVPREEPVSVGAPADNGNVGIVPPWLT
ncbi:MAG: hypothetical protein JWM98_1334 [Thermoleophilia bacterium]|nr:hypothetical protein [Thermoleophilia bacterium]